jgi:CBS domain-containing protein
MANTVREVMAGNPITVPASATVVDAARLMRDEDIGDVVVVEDDTVRGILTDRDIVVRAVAEERSPESVTAGEVCTSGVVEVGPDDSIDRAGQLMREHAIRRLLVVEDGSAVGIVSIGDLAVEHDDTSALADISAAPPNN